MAVPLLSSGSYTQSANDDYMAEAFSRIGIRGDQINADHINEATRSANLMLAQWTTQGFKQFALKLAEISFMPTVATYAQTLFPAGTTQIFSSIIQVNSTFDVPMIRISRYDYEQIPYKANPGRPDRFFWDGLGNTLAQRYMILWPVPDMNYTARVWCICRAQDVGTLINAPDIGYEWIDAFSAGLCARMAEKYRPDLFDAKMALANTAYLNAHQGERERGPLRLRVDHRTRESPR